MADLLEFTRKEKWDLKELPSLAGKVAIVTGANGPEGLGYHTAYPLWQKGAKVFIGARTLEKAKSGIEHMVAASPSLDANLLKPLVVDLADYKALKKVAEKFVAEEERLDILVNNAGLVSQTPGSERNNYGISITFGTNHVGTFLFTTTLLPLLVKTAKLPGTDVRVVTVASTAHWETPATAKFDSLEAFNESFSEAPATGGPLEKFGVYENEGERGAIYRRYGFSKVANILFAKELQRRVDAQNVPILSLSLCPAGVATAGAGDFLGRDTDFFKEGLSPADGGLTPVFAAAHPEPREQEEKYKFGFLFPWGGLKETSALAKDEGGVNAKTLWETSEKVLADILKA